VRPGGEVSGGSGQSGHWGLSWVVNSGLVFGCLLFVLLVECHVVALVGVVSAGSCPGVILWAWSLL